MQLGTIAKSFQRLVADNSALILTSIGVTGVVTTAVLTAKASFKAAEILQRDQQERFHLSMPSSEGTFVGPLDRQAQTKLVWKEYIPAAGVAALTIVAIIGANRIGTRKAAALASAFGISEKAFTEYKEKVVEKLGKNKEAAVRDEIAEERIRKTPVTKSEVLIVGNRDVLCHDMWSGRYFTSDMEDLRRAENDINHQILHYHYASLTDFYQLIGLTRTTESDVVGWNSDKKLELSFTTTLSDDNRPCIAVGFITGPTHEFQSFH